MTPHTQQYQMSAFLEERVLSVHHWTDRLFSFTTTRDQALRFSNGHFTMIGLRGDNGKWMSRMGETGLQLSKDGIDRFSQFMLVLEG